MRILYIAPALENFGGGIIKYAIVFRKCLEDIKIQVDTLDVDITGKKHNNTIRESYKLAKKYVNENKDNIQSYDLVHVELGANNYREYYFAYFIAKKGLNVPMFVTIHDTPVLISAQFAYLISLSAIRPVRVIRRIFDVLFGRLLDAVILKKTAKIFILTKTGIDAFNNKKKIYWHKVIYLPHITFEEDSIIEKNRHNYDIVPFEIIYLGYIIKSKGIEDLFLAYNKLLKLNNHINIRLRICGDMPSYYSEQLKKEYNLELHELVKGMEDKVIFEGFVPEEKLSSLLKNASLMVVPLKDKNKCSMSGSLIHGMTEGLPIIASDNSVTREILINNVSGLLYEHGDYIKLAEYIKLLIDDPKLRVKLGSNARKHILENNGWEKVKQVISGHYYAKDL